MKSHFNLIEVKCNLCNSIDKEIISKEYVGNIVRCKKCGLFYRSPRLSDEDEISRYRNHVFGELERDILNKAKKEIFISSLKKLDQYKGKILDIGCSNGYFLTLAKQRGWQPYGIEISNSLLRKAKDNLGEERVFGVPLRMARFTSNFFDVITMWDVLDHLRDPLGELLEVRRVLREEGLLVIRVRNMSFHMLINKLFKTNLLGIVKKPTVFHLYGFNNQNLRILLNKAHFTRIKIKNSKLTARDPYSQIEFLGSNSISLIKRIYWAFSEFIYFLSFQKIFMSPSIVVYAEKT